MKTKLHPVVFSILSFLSVSSVGFTDEISRSAAAGPLNLTTAWNGGVVPGSGDIAVWQLGANSGTTTLGADLSWSGIKVLDAGFIATGGPNTLTLGADGIDMTNAEVDATFNFNYSLAASQTWQVASGRTLFLNNALIAGGASSELTLSGPGTVYSSSATDQTYSGGTVLENGVTVAMGANNGGGNFGTGSVTIRDDVTLVGHAAGIRTMNTPTVFNGAANTLTLGSASIPTRFIINGGMDLGTAQRTIILKNSDVPGTANLALTLDGTVTSGVGGSLVLSNGNATPATEQVWVKLGNSTPSLTFNGILEIGENVQGYFNNSAALGSGTDLVVNGELDVSNKLTSTINPTIKSLAGSGTVFSNRSNSSPVTLTIDGGVATSSTDFSGSIDDGLAPVNIAKTGSTTQIFSGVNSYTGTTAVNGGTLLINGDQSLATGVVTVALGATLGGTGTVGGLTQLNGTLAPGTSPGELTFNQGLNVNGGSTVVFEGGDLVVVNGQLDLNDDWTLSLGGGFADGGSTILFSYGTLAASPDLVPTFNIAGLGFIPTEPLNLFNDTMNQQIVLMGVSAIPEPSAGILVGLGLGLVVFLKMRRRREA